MAPPSVPPELPHRVVIVGGGFAGLYAARSLGSDPEVRVTLVDRRNFHLFGAWSFLTRGRGTRLITGRPLRPPIEQPEPPVLAPMGSEQEPAAD